MAWQWKPAILQARETSAGPRRVFCHALACRTGVIFLFFSGERGQARGQREVRDTRDGRGPSRLFAGDRSVRGSRNMTGRFAPLLSNAVIGWWFEGVSGGGIAWTMVGVQALFFRSPPVARTCLALQAHLALALARLKNVKTEITPVLQAKVSLASRCQRPLLAGKFACKMNYFN